MAAVNGVYDGRSAWSPTYTAYPEYKYVETLYATLLTLNRIIQKYINHEYKCGRYVL